MAIDDIQTFYKQFPEAFKLSSLSSDWENWRMIPIDNPESTEPEPIESGLFHRWEKVDNKLSDDSEGMSLPNVPAFFQDSPLYPGTPVHMRRSSDAISQPDALAFYLPFHHYYSHEKPTPWGIYLVVEGTMALAEIVYRGAQGALSLEEAHTISRIFLYGIQAFHHAVESFATRLEITHRQAVYTTGVAQLFRETHGQHTCMEEALAAAYGYRKVRKSVKEAFKQNKQKQECALGALEDYLKNYCHHSAYKLGTEFIYDKDFRAARAKFAEENHQKTFPCLPKWEDSTLWLSFPYAFGGIGRVDSRAKYLVHRDSSINYRESLPTGALKLT